MASRIPPGTHASLQDPTDLPIPQAIQQSLANFDGLQHEDCLHGASLIAKNSSLVAYVLKKGLIRVLPQTGERFLLRQHSADGAVHDIVFFHASSDVLATVSPLRLVMWKYSTVLLELQASPGIQFSRLVWHPLDLNKFYVLDTQQRAVLVDSTHLKAEPDPVHGYTVAKWPENATSNCIPDVVDVCWHSQGRVVTISATSSNAMMVWREGQMLEKVIVPGNAKVLRCVSLGENRIVTLQQNAFLTVWDTTSSLRMIQTLQLSTPAAQYESLLLAIAAKEPNSVGEPYIIVASRQFGKVYVMAFAEGCIRSVHAVETAEPCYAISSARALPTLHSDDPNGVDVEFAAYHPHTIQTITVPWPMLQQPQQGITVQPLQSQSTQNVPDNSMVFKDYEVDEEEDYEDHTTEPPLPAPPSVSIENNPFANWLGAIAAKNAPYQAAPVAPTPPPSYPNSAASPFLLDRSRDASPAVPPPNLPVPVNPIPPPPHMQVPVPTPPAQARKEVTPPPAAPEVPPPQNDSSTTSLADTVRGIVQEELRSIVLPRLPNKNKQSNKPPPTKEEVEVMVEAAQAATVKKVLIPVVESITSQVLQKVSEHLEQQQKRSDTTKNQLESMSKQLSKMTALVSELTKEVHSLGNQQQQNGSSPHNSNKKTPPQQSAQPKVDETELKRQAVRQLLQQGKIQDAFVAALHSGSEMTRFCCQHADIKTVLDADPPVLTQGVVLCVMQHLATLLNVGTNVPQLELEWLQELALSFDKQDASVRQHWPQVVQEVLGYLEQRQQRQEPALKRPLHRLVQIVRGL